MDERDWLAERFEEQRPRLRGVAYRMLGSLSEADDAVQEAWLRLSRTDTGEVENLGGWLTTVVARISLNMLRSRKVRREEPLGVHMPDPIVDRADGTDPEHEALLADSVGLALLVVLETLTPPERLAFVLHDIFAVPFDEIAPIVDRSPEAARQLASRARRRIQRENAVPDADPDTQREVVDAFLAAARDGDFEALLAVLDPDVVLRADFGPEGGSARGPRSAVGRRAGALLRAAWAWTSAGAGQRRRGSRRDAGRRAVRRRGGHGQGREDRRDGLPRRPGAVARARPHDPRRVTVAGCPGGCGRSRMWSAAFAGRSDAWKAALGPSARSRSTSRIAVRARQLCIDAAPWPVVVLTDEPSDFAGLGVRAVAHTPTGPMAADYRRLEIETGCATGAAAYHDKRFALKAALENFETAIFVDADSRLRRPPGTGLAAHPGVAMRPLSTPETIVEHLTRYGPQRRPHLFERLAVELLGSAEPLSSARWIVEDCFAVTRDERESSFFEAWGRGADLFQSERVFSGEGGVIGLAAAFAGWSVRLRRAHRIRRGYPARVRRAEGSLTGRVPAARSLRPVAEYSAERGRRSRAPAGSPDAARACRVCEQRAPEPGVGSFVIVARPAACPHLREKCPRGEPGQLGGLPREVGLIRVAGSRREAGEAPGVVCIWLNARKPWKRRMRCSVLGP